MNLRILTDAELLRYADNERDRLSSTELEIELARRLEGKPDIEKEIDKLEDQVMQMEEKLQSLEVEVTELEAERDDLKEQLAEAQTLI